jgi:DNA-binding transcriptional LysR family regulator
MAKPDERARSSTPRFGMSARRLLALAPRAGGWRHGASEGNAGIAGLGAAVVVPPLVRAELDAGRLVRPFDVTVRYERAYWLIDPEARRRSPKIRAFRDWILAEAERDRMATEDGG